MGRSIKKILKSIENKNGKCKERESEMEKSQDKERPKVKSLWSKWSSLFSRSSSSSRRLRNDKESIQLYSEDAEILPPIVMNNLPKDMERWSHDESLDVNSQMLNIPIEPGRQVSTIILSPTKTGFKAVIAHYDMNASLKRSLTKDFKTVSEQIENRRTLTLVFDMNQRTFEEIGVGKSQCKMEYSEPDEDADGNRNISASALYVRNDADELVESAAFLQAQLSLDDMALTESSLFISEEKSVNLERRHVSCRSMEKARVAFKTISEPMWREKEKMRKEMLIKQNVQEMLNQFIFLDRDDSLMNYPRECEEENVSSDDRQCMEETCLMQETLLEEPKKLEEEEEEVYTETVCAMEAVYSEKAVFVAETKHIEEQTIPEKPEDEESTGSFAPDKFLDSVTVSARSVAPNLLVNIKPFKEYIGNAKAISDVQLENVVTKKIEIITPKKADKPPIPPPPPPPPPFVCGLAAKRKRSQERSRRTESKMNAKARPLLCIKCGVEAKGLDTKKACRESTVYLGKSVRSSVTTQTGAEQSSMAIIPGPKEEIPCTLCSVWKLYKKKSSFTSITHVGDSFEDMLKELEGYDHTMIFRQNLSQFRTKINTRTPSIELKKSHSSLSFAEVIELEEGKISRVKNQKSADEDAKSDEVPRVTVRVIEFIRRNDEKTVELQRFKKAMEKLQFEKIVAGPRKRIHRLENSSMVFTFRECNKMIKIMAQKVEENMLQNLSSSDEIIVSQGSITIIFPAYLGTGMSDIRIPRRHSENRLDEFKRNLSSYKRTGQIPDVINQLLTNKVDDLRKELLTRMNATRMSYHSMHMYTIRRKDEEKSTSKCSVSTTTGSCNTGEEVIEQLDDTPEESEEQDPSASEDVEVAKNETTQHEIAGGTSYDKLQGSSETNSMTDREKPERIADRPEIELQSVSSIRRASMSWNSHPGSRTPSIKEEAPECQPAPRKLPAKPSDAGKEESVPIAVQSKFSNRSLRTKEATTESAPGSNRIIFAEDLVMEQISTEKLDTTSRIHSATTGSCTTSNRSSPSETFPENYPPSTRASSVKSKEMGTVIYPGSVKPSSATMLNDDYVSKVSSIDEDYSASKNMILKSEETETDASRTTEIKDRESEGLRSKRSEEETPSVSNAIADSSSKTYIDTRASDEEENEGRQERVAQTDSFVKGIEEDLLDAPFEQEKNSTETEPIYMNAEAFKEVLSFQASDYKVHSCLTFFIPYMHQIQTAAEILNNVAYNFPVRKETETRPDRECIEITRSYTVLPDDKFIPDGVESLIMKKCVEKNVVNGVEMSKTSKKEITTIESSKSGNHFLVKNNRIFTTNDRIKKKLGEDATEVMVKMNPSEDLEDLNGIRFLYCNRSDGNETGESSMASCSSHHGSRVRESSSSVIGVREYGEIERGITRVRLDVHDSGTERLILDVKDTDNTKPNKVDDSLQETDLGTEQLPMKREVVTLLQKNKEYITNYGESGSLGSGIKESENTLSAPGRESAAGKITEESAIVQTARTPSVRVVKKIGKGIVSQRMTTKSSGGGKELLIRQESEELPGKKDGGNVKRMSVFIMLSKRKPDKERSSSTSGKYIAANTRTRAVVLTGPKNSKLARGSELHVKDISPKSTPTSSRHYPNSDY